ncbi:MAG TPA: HAMP domain-containing protein, partial [Isosphaeraceae bacterium]|nr:HAMP domain-containing protein [Isosphaeraceae bacterium]
MNWLSKSLRNKLIAGSMIAVVAMILLPMVYAWSSQTQKASADLVMHTYDVIALGDSVRNSLLNAQRAELGYVATRAPELQSQFEKLASDIPDLLGRLRSLVEDNPGQLERATNLTSQVRTWLRESPAHLQPDELPHEVTTSLAAGQHASTSVQEVLRVLEEFAAGESELLGQRIEENEQARQVNQGVVIFGTCVAIFSFLALSVWLARSIIDPIQELTSAMEGIQEGDLRVRVSARSADELGRLGQGFNAMAGSLQKNARELDKRDIQAGILQITQVLAASNDLPHLLDKALEQILDVAHCQAGAIYVRSPEDDTLRVLVSIGTGQEMADREVRPGQGIVGRVAETRVAYFAPADSDEAPL